MGDVGWEMWDGRWEMWDTEKTDIIAA